MEFCKVEMWSLPLCEPQFLDMRLLDLVNSQHHTAGFQAGQLIAVTEPHAALCLPAKGRLNKAELNAQQC